MEGFTKQLRERWFILAFFVSLVMWYGDTNSRLNAVEAKLAEQKTINEQISDIKTDIAVIKTNVTYIKAQLD